VQRIIRRHGGEIRASAAPGGGATFSFNVPPTEGQDPNHQEASEVLIAGGGQTER
jgi:K+-sensing histidine kinase KdpD